MEINKSLNSKTIYPSEFGAIGDGIHDDTKAIEQAIDLAFSTGISVQLESNKTYRITKKMKFNKSSSLHLFSNASGNNKPKLLLDIENGLAFDFQGLKVGDTKTLEENVKSTAKFIKPSNLEDIHSGLLCEIMSTKSWYHDPRPPANPPVRWVGYNLGQAREGSYNTIQLSNDFKAPREHIIDRSFTMLSGDNKSHSATVIDFDEVSKTATFTPTFSNKIHRNDEYVFPQAFKGELNVVQRLEKSEIELRNILFDGYHVKTDESGESKERVTLDFFKPISIIIENIDFDWLNNSGPKSEFEMLRVKYGIDCIFRNVLIKNASRIAFQIERCFNTVLEYCGVESSNNNFLGYGVNVQNATQTTVKNSWFWGCRRGVDFDSVRDFGNAYPSRLGLIDSCTNYGGGVRQEGRKYEAPWYPEGNWDEEKSRNFGFGSHGPADHITYINNTMMNTYRGIFTRGTNERIINNKFIGKMEECIGIWFGGNHTIEGNEYIHPSISGQLDDNDNFRETSTFEGSNSYKKDFPKRFIGIATLNHSPTSYQRGFITVRNNIARAVTKEFFYHQWSAGKYLEDVSLENNHVIIWPEDSNDLVYFFNSNHSGELINYIDKNNHITVKNGTYSPYRLRNILTKSCTILPENKQDLIKIEQSDKEISTRSSFNKTGKPSNKQGALITKTTISPYSKLSRFRCSVNTNVTNYDNPGHIIVALFRENSCIFTKVVYCPTPESIVDVNFDYIDVPSKHKDITYSLRFGNISGVTDNVVTNLSKFNFGGTAKTQLMVQEI